MSRIITDLVRIFIALWILGILMSFIPCFPAAFVVWMIVLKVLEL